MKPLTFPLADEELFPSLMEKISREGGFPCASYKDRCLKRRIAVRMRACSAPTYGAYASVLDRDPTEYERLLDTLTINVTKLFRNWETFRAIAARVIPQLWALPGEIRVWSAGCASGDEPYSLAILFHEHARAMGEVDRLSRVQILGTDVDRASLEAARRAEFAPAAFADTPVHIRERFFRADGVKQVVASEVRALVSFERQDLLRSVPTEPLDLIVCRNVLIYFDRASQERLFEAFHGALRSGGFLVLGKVETLFGSAKDQFAPVESRERIFQRT